MTLDEACEYRHMIRDEADGNKEYGFNDPWKIFFKKMQLCGPQMYGPRITKRVMQYYDLKEVNARKDRGDALNHYDDHIEFKVSMGDQKKDLIWCRRGNGKI